MKLKSVLIIGLVIHAICISNAFAQKTAIRFKHISYKDGLFQSPVSTILQDRSGYIWIGNWSGLSRYDGTTFKNFRQNDTTSTSISHNRINKVYEDRDRNLWIGTSGGLNLYDQKTEQFRHVGISTAKGGANYIATLQQDSYGTMWVSTFKGIKQVSQANDRLENIPAWQKAGEDDLYQGVSFALFEDNKKTIWAGIKQGLKRFDPKNKKVLPLPAMLLANKELSAAKIVVIKQDPAGDMWFGTEENGLFRYNAEKNYCIRYLHQENDANSLPSNWINDILVRDGKIWISTRNGLAIFDVQQQIFSNYNHDSADSRSISDDAAWSLMQDKTGNVWIGTYAGGINIYYPGNANFTNIGERIGNSIGLNKPLANAIVEDKDDGLWIGTIGGGLNYINRNKGIAKYYPVTDIKKHKLSNEIKAIAKDQAGNLWLGTLDGLCKFDTRNGSIKYIDLEVINNKTGAKLINAFAIDRDGIWVATNGGGLRFVNFEGHESETIISVPGKSNRLSDNYINALLKDGGDIWIATQNGLNRYNKTSKTFTIYKRQKRTGLGNNNVLCLFKDSRGILWIGTDGGGLSYLDTKANKIYTIKQQNGLIDDVVVSLVEDNSGKLWVGTNNGLSQISFNKIEFPLKPSDYQIANYNSANGLPGNQFLSNAAIKTGSGEILFGGMNGVTAFYPDRIIKNSYKPDILLTGFAIKNKEVAFGDNSPLKLPVSETSKITLPYADNNISIKFSALNFINPDKNQYAYKMSGLPKGDEWSVIGNQKEVSFINLEPGDYIFSVKAANNDGVWNNTGRSIAITVLPPLWRTWWAYLLYIMVIVAVSYKVIQFFRIRAKLESDLHHEHLENERQQEFYKMKLDFFTNISHEIRTPLTLILGPVENLEKSTQDNSLLNRQVLQIKNNAERLLRLIGELMDFRKAETGNMVLYIQKNNIVPFIREIYLSFLSLAESRQIQYDFICEEKETMLFADRDQLEKVFFNILSNAFKFTPNQGKIKLEILQEGNAYLTIRITDSGKGIPLEFQHKLFTNFYQVQPDNSKPGTGVGLALSKNIIELHQGTIEVESRPVTPDTAGETIFTVKLPFNNSTSDNVHVIPENENTDHVSSYKLQSEIDVLTHTIPPEKDRKYTVLLAEDNDELRNFIAESLPDYQIISCINGSEAYEKAIVKIPDLIISDVMMPVMDGLGFCRRIKTDERTSHIPVILLTALAAHIHQVNGFETGADVYLTKPFSTRILELNVHNLLASRELMRKKFAQQITLQPQNLPISAPDDRFIKKLMQIIEDHMEDPEFGVIALGNEIGMSKTVLYKKMCALTDQSPADFIKSIRLKKAAFLLQQNTLNINEVSSLVGFNDRKYFSKEFKKQHGISPSEMMVSNT
ncbi:MAG: hybrid sensor histidine kinase/response regulator [Mucilaginibacter sp.]|nr:hybrid sensor histidine kinase/response regulator [Mucilaginibacter sp.]